jgi:translation initiation factor 1
MVKKLNSFDGLVFSTNPDQELNYFDSNGETETLTNAKQYLRIELDKKQRRGKEVTLVSGFIGKEEDLKELAKKIKTKCGVGGTAKEGGILIQGDFRQKISDLLIAEGFKIKKINF